MSECPAWPRRRTRRLEEIQHKTELVVPKRESHLWILAQNVTWSYVLCMPARDSEGPDWGRLFQVAAGQSGYFTTRQAAGAGYSTHLLRKHIHAGRVSRPLRAIYRLVH